MLIGLKGIFKGGKGLRLNSTSSSVRQNSESSLRQGLSHDAADMTDTESDTSSIGEYDMVG